MSPSTRRFFAATIVLSLPLVLVLLSYVIFDPFMVLRSYEDYNASHGAVVNRDMISTQQYFNLSSQFRYDSFIFGNSRTMAYTTEDWTPWIDSKATYHFDAWAESIFGVAGKFRLLDRRGVPIRNALIVLDSELLSTIVDIEDLPYMKHPATSGRTFAFHALYLKAYFTPSFLFPYLHTKYDQAFQEPGGPEAFPGVYYTPFRNNFILPLADQQVMENETGFYAPKMSGFIAANQPESVGPAIMTPQAKGYLREIQAITQRQNTDIRIIVSPLYNKVRMNPSDLKVLTDMFGVANVSDFSGANAFTNDYRNFYETSHYRPHVAREIMKRIYTHKPVARDSKSIVASDTMQIQERANTLRFYGNLINSLLAFAALIIAAILTYLVSRQNKLLNAQSELLRQLAKKKPSKQRCWNGGEPF